MSTASTEDARYRGSGGWITFAFHLPFTLGLGQPDSQIHTMAIVPDGFDPAAEVAWRDPAAAELFGAVPLVRMRFHRQDIQGVPVFPKDGMDAIGVFYDGADLPSDAIPPFGSGGGMYRQWVSVETPNSRLTWEPEVDDAFAFHRALRALNDFLTAYLWAFGDRPVRPVTTHDIGGIVVSGSYDDAGQWGDFGIILVHPDRIPAPVKVRDSESDFRHLARATRAVNLGFPFITSKLWYRRSYGAADRGDQVDRVVSLQVAMENMFFSIWRMTMVDQHKTAAHINKEFERGVTFETLFKSTVPRLLGGDWNRRNLGTPPGRYWSNVYHLRNLVVHTGYVPSIGEGDQAQQSYLDLRKFMMDRVWNNRRTFPRTMLARLGEPAALGYNRDKDWVNELDASFKAEQLPWWLPYDIAGRE